MASDAVIKTVADLIDRLKQYDMALEVFATWEGTVEPINVYQTPGGEVLIDADSNYYRAGWESGKREVGTRVRKLRDG